MLRASPWLCAAKAKARRVSQPGRASTKPSFDEATFRPRVSNTILSLHSLHKGNKVLDADRRYSAQGQLKAVQQSTISIMPSLYYYLSQRCGVAFDEADALVRAGRLLLDGRPLQATSALAVQVPATIVDKLGIEIVTLRGERVPAADRWRHRYYGLHHKDLESRLGAPDSDPRAWPHVVQRAAPCDPAEVLGPSDEPVKGRSGEEEERDGGGGGEEDDGDDAPSPRRPPLYYGDGFDALSNPLPIVPPGFLGSARLGGIMLVTNDVSIRPHLTWATGFDATYDIVLQRGTPQDVVQRVLEAATECAGGKGFIVEGGTVPYRQPSVELRHALPSELDPRVVAGADVSGATTGGAGDDAWDPTVAAAAADASLAAADESAAQLAKKKKRKRKLRRRTTAAESVRPANFTVDRAVPYPVIRMNAVTLNRETRLTFLAAGGVCIRATRLAIFDLAATGLAPGEFRRLTAAEMQQLVAMDKRHKTRRIISHLRGVAPAPPAGDGDEAEHDGMRSGMMGDGGDDDGLNMWEDMEKPRSHPKYDGVC